MDIDRLPPNAQALPAFYARIVGNEVMWSMTAQEDGTDYRVWRSENLVVVKASAMITKTGEVTLILSDHIPDQCVIIADVAAGLAIAALEEM